MAWVRRAVRPSDGRVDRTPDEDGYVIIVADTVDPRRSTKAATPDVRGPARRRLVAGHGRLSAMPRPFQIPRRCRRHQRRPLRRRGRPTRRVGRLLALVFPGPPDRPARRRRPLAASSRPRPRTLRSARSCTTTTCAIPRCSPRSWPRSTCCPAAASTSAIGAGWNKPEYDAIGLPFDPTSASGRRGWPRRSRCSRAASADGPFSFAGEHYTITDYDGQPKPVQRPHPPFFIGGGGRRDAGARRRARRDIVGLAPRIPAGRLSRPATLTWAGDRGEDRLGREAAGERFDELSSTSIRRSGR